MVKYAYKKSASKVKGVRAVFGSCNTDFLHIENVFSVSIGQSEVGKKRYAFGETEFYQLGIKFKGKTKIHYNGKELDYYDGTVLYLPCESKTDIPYNKVYKEQGHGVCIFFTSEHKLPEKAKIYANCTAEASRLFRDILSAYTSGNSLETKSLFYRLLSVLDASDGQKNNVGDFSAVLEYINANITKPYIEISELSALYGCSDEAFRKKFAKHFGMPPKKYITEQKMLFLKKALLNSQKSIEKVARECGFDDNNYFSRLFKAKVGCTPSQFRKKYKRFM